MPPVPGARDLSDVDRYRLPETVTARSLGRPVHTTHHIITKEGTRMTTTENTQDEIVAAGVSAADQLREQIKAIEHARDTQPERLGRPVSAETSEPRRVLIDTFGPARLLFDRRDGYGIEVAGQRVRVEHLRGVLASYDAAIGGDDDE